VARSGGDAAAAAAHLPGRGKWKKNSAVKEDAKRKCSREKERMGEEERTSGKLSKKEYLYPPWAEGAHI